MSTEVAPAAAVDDTASPKSAADVDAVQDDTPAEPAEATTATDDSESKNEDLEQPKEKDDVKMNTKAAPQAAPSSPGGNGGTGEEEESEGEFEDCKISPLDADRQRRNLRNALLSVGEEDNQLEQQQSSLHEDEYSQSLKQNYELHQ